MRRYILLVIAAFGLFMGAVCYLPQVVSVSSNACGRELPVRSVETSERQAALTFECAWGKEHLGEILGILEKEGVKASFFVTGDWAERYPEEVLRIKNAGHDIGNHSRTHRSLAQMSDEAQAEEIVWTHRKIKELTGIDMELFRPPYGDFSDALIQNAKKQGYLTVTGNVDSLDWKEYGREELVKEILEHKELKNGSILLFQSEAEFTGAALSDMIRGLKEKGYRLVPVSQMICREKFAVDVDGRQKKVKEKPFSIE